jgi:hypothetical protein
MKACSLEMVDRMLWHSRARASRIPHAALVPPLLFANRYQFICVIHGAG